MILTFSMCVWVPQAFAFENFFFCSSTSFFSLCQCFRNSIVSRWLFPLCQLHRSAHTIASNHLRLKCENRFMCTRHRASSPWVVVFHAKFHTGKKVRMRKNAVSERDCEKEKTSVQNRQKRTINFVLEKDPFFM